MRLLIGLGNPGAEYARNRHNIGFMAVDAIVRRHGFSPWRTRFQGQCAEGVIGGEKVLALKPETFMNLSGQSAAAALRFFKLTPGDVIVFHDDLDLAPGAVRIKTGGGTGGHNGLKSLDAHIGKDYRRVRIGIGHPGDKTLVTPYVLGNFAKAEQDWLSSLFDAMAADAALLFETDGAAFLARLPRPQPRIQPGKPETGGAS
ncbi:MAG: aminoacyl-tRNA hydrolase [Rhodospirillaceae bacterium]|nr:aminoacyl-tRNA hydrolase [Rhodospirillaceae bacterium]